MEKTNARNLTPEMFPEPPELGVTDVSFISLKAILPPALSVLRGEQRRFIALVKPQFELGPQAARKGGIVADEAGEKLEALARERAAAAGWAPLTWHRCRLRGTDGNQEYFLHARRALPGARERGSQAATPD